MGIQYGRWNFQGVPATPYEIAMSKCVLAPYGTESVTSYSRTGMDVLHCALHTTKESLREVQPQVLPSGTVVTWDGRLDNRNHLLSQLNATAELPETDLAIVAAAYERWGTHSFSMLVGDWAISIWDAGLHCLILAKDPIGARHLFYRLAKDQVRWSTLLDPLVLSDRKNLTLDERYIAGLLGFFPATHLTPYQEIHSVPPSCYVRIRDRGVLIQQYWCFDSSKSVRYRTDAEYEEHFRAVFSEAVRRRLRSHKPIMAELSGGMDSSSIVCMADRIIADGLAESPCLDTLSYFANDEPQWDERPFFTRVEQKRGRIGCQIEVNSQDSLKFDFDSEHFAPSPASGGRPTQSGRTFTEYLKSRDSRVVLSGIGGDEVMGGVPAPWPQLADLLSSGQFMTLGHHLKRWALSTRKPLLHLAVDTVKNFLPPAITRPPKHRRPGAWLRVEFCNRNRAALGGYPSRIRLSGPLPSFQDNLNTLEGLRRQLSCSMPSSAPPHEKRFPFLDRDLLEFIFSIPSEQLLRPSQRRSLMRRALVGIVPDEVLNRKRKAVITRGPMLGISEEWARMCTLTKDMRCAALGIVDAPHFLAALQRARDGEEVSTVPLLRTLGIELWLRHMDPWNIFSETQAAKKGAAGNHRSLHERNRLPVVGSHD
jgi:asparagine synthase (glutamine-hydrolysing)